MGWVEFWDYVSSDTDESLYEHLENTYGKDAPIIHAALDYSADNLIGTIPVVGQIYSVANAKTPIVKEAKDVIWEDRHEILAVGSAVPAVGTVISAADATLHAAESVENNVEFFIEGAFADDEPIYDEAGNVVGHTDKWETDHMKEKGKHASSHGANATLGAVLTLTGASYFKGGKAAVQASKNGGNFIEKIFIKNADDAAKFAEKKADEVVDVLREGEKKIERTRNADIAKKEYDVKKATEEVKTIEEKKNAAKKEAEYWKDRAKEMSNNETVQKISNDYAAKADSAVKDLKKAKEKKEAAEQALEKANKATPEEFDDLNTLQKLQDARQAASAAKKKAEECIGIKAIDLLQNSNNLRSFLTTTVSIGMATVSEHDKNVERFGLPDSDKWIKD